VNNSDYIAMNDWVTVNNKFKRMQMEILIALSGPYFYQNFPGRIEETHINPWSG
jgi:hypothetical protein